MTTEELISEAYSVDCTKASHKVFAWQLKLVCLLLGNLILEVGKLITTVERTRL